MELIFKNLVLSLRGLMRRHTWSIPVSIFLSFLLASASVIVDLEMSPWFSLTKLSQPRRQAGKNPL